MERKDGTFPFWVFTLRAPSAPSGDAYSIIIWHWQALCAISMPVITIHCEGERERETAAAGQFVNVGENAFTYVRLQMR